MEEPTPTRDLEAEISYYQSLLPELRRAAFRYKLLEKVVKDGKLLVATDTGFELIKDLDIYTASLTAHAGQAIPNSYPHCQDGRRGRHPEGVP